jgi:hypothetical protein
VGVCGHDGVAGFPTGYYTGNDACEFDDGNGKVVRGYKAVFGEEIAYPLTDMHKCYELIGVGIIFLKWIWA